MSTQIWYSQEETVGPSFCELEISDKFWSLVEWMANQHSLIYKSRVLIQNRRMEDIGGQLQHNVNSLNAIFHLFFENDDVLTFPREINKSKHLQFLCTVVVKYKVKSCTYIISLW